MGLSAALLSLRGGGVSKLFRVISVLFLFSFLNNACAVITVSNQTYSRNGVSYSSVPDACNSLSSQYYTGSFTYYISKPGGYADHVLFCRVRHLTGSATYDISFSINPVCPANSSKLKYNTCTCASGFIEEGDKCVDPNAPPEEVCNFGDIANSGYYDVGKSASGSPAIMACLGGCESIFEGLFPAGNALVDGEKHYFALGSYNKTGKKCSASGDSAIQGMNSLPSDTCGQDQVMGKVNGKNVCVKASSPDNPTSTPDPATTTETETKNTVKDQDESGNARETTTTVKTNSDGSTTTTVTTTTTSPDGSTSSTTTTTTTGGSGGGGFGGGSQGGEEGSEDGECAKNPSGKGCGGTAADISGKSFHTAKGKTFSTVLQSASDDIKASPLGNSFTGFFTVSGGGTCPVSTWNIPYLNAVVAFDYMCQSFVLDGLLILKGVLLLVASFFAFRVAVE